MARRIFPTRRFLYLPAWAWLIPPVIFFFWVRSMGPPAPISEPPVMKEALRDTILFTPDGDGYRFVKLGGHAGIAPLWVVTHEAQKNAVVTRSFKIGAGNESGLWFNPGLYHRRVSCRYSLFAHRFDKEKKDAPEDLSGAALERIRPQIVAELNRLHPDELRGNRLEQLLTEGLTVDTWWCRQNVITILLCVSVLIGVLAVVAMFFEFREDAVESPREGGTVRLLCLIGLAFAATGSRADDWRALFNGKDLTGWRANNDPESFAVKDGSLRVQASGKTSAHLFFAGDRKDGFESFKDFELEATTRAESNSNGGLFVHTDMATRDAQKHLAKGYEVQLNSSAKERRKTGSLYAVVDLEKSPVDETKWFTVRVVVKDKRITVALDGKEVVDYTEPAGVVRPKERAGRLFAADGGAIAIQAHDAGSVWYFKDIRVKRLP